MTEESKTEAQTSPINGVVGVSFKDVMSVLPAVIAGLTVLVFTASAAREWAYYHVIGEDFISLASPADYTSAALRELSTSFAAAAAAAVLVKMFFLLTIGPPPPPGEGIAQRFPRLRFPIIMTFALMIMALFWVTWVRHVRLGGDFFLHWIIPGMLCWMWFSTWFSRHPHVRFYRLARTWHQLLMWGPLVIVFIIASGHDQAVIDLARQRGEYRIVHSTGLVEDDVQLLRALSQGVLILRVPTRDVSFLTYGSFKSIDRVGSSQ